ncbi:MAG: hypothetical protein AAGG68_13475 [Bacteroidota bacterium]
MAASNRHDLIKVSQGQKMAEKPFFVLEKPRWIWMDAESIQIHNKSLLMSTFSIWTIWNPHYFDMTTLI